MPLTISIDLGSPVPAYRQIADRLRETLVTGHLRPGDALPPVRQLATDLGVHFNTVAEAYRTLATEGWLMLRRGSGAVVVERGVPPPAAPEQRDRLALALRDAVLKMRAAGWPAEEIAIELHKALKGTPS
ncbi:MAG: GntR family transcriptional regulator [Bryobacteraceae bacterium]|nr:GntR family transcriptional regulator [Bryobacteraceae bacterium]